VLENEVILERAQGLARRLAEWHAQAPDPVLHFERA
jgi:hypothetical protein